MPSDQDHCGRVRELLPPRTTLRLSLGAVRTRPNGHIRCRLRCSLDRLLGACRTHVDIRLQKRLQGYQTDARFGAVRILEGIK